MARQVRAVYGFGSGQVHEDFFGRFDVPEVANSSLRSAENWRIKQSGSLKVRPGTRTLGTWHDGVVDGVPDFVVFRLKGNARDFAIILSGGLDDEEDPTVTVRSLSEDGDEQIEGTFPIDEAIALGDPDVIIQAIQAGDSLFIVSNYFHPQRIFVSSSDAISIDSSPVTDEPGVQFYKEIQGTYSYYHGIDGGSGRALIGSLDSRATQEIADAASDYSYVRFLGRTFETTNVAWLPPPTGPGVPLFTDADLDSDGNVLWIFLADDISDEYPDFSGVKLSRPWPLPSGTENFDETEIEDDFGSANAPPPTDYYRPNSIEFHERRLIFGCPVPAVTASYNQPSAAANAQFNMSSLTDPFVIIPPVSGADAASPIEVIVAFDNGDKITWMKSGRSLIVATTSGQWQMETQDILTAESMRWTRISSVGSLPVQPVSWNGASVFVADSQAVSVVAPQENYDLTSAAQVSPFDGCGFDRVNHLAASSGVFGETADVLAVVGDGDFALYVKSPLGRIAGATRMHFSDDFKAWRVVALGGRLIVFGYSIETEEYVALDFEADDDGYALDFRFDDNVDIATTAWSVPGVTGDYLKGKTISVLASGGPDLGSSLRPIGEVDVDEDGNFTTPFAVTDVSYGIPVAAFFEPLVSPPVDNDGSLHLQMYRVLGVIFGYTRTRQFVLNGGDVLPYITTPVNEDRPAASSQERVPLLGYSTVPQLRVENRQPYSAQIDTITLEFQVDGR